MPGDVAAGSANYLDAGGSATQAAEASALAAAALGRLRASIEALVSLAADGLALAPGSAAGWGPLEVLIHVMFWHEHYVATVQRVLAGKRPNLPKGSYRQINDRALEAERDRPVAEVAARLQAAQHALELLATHERTATVRFAYKRGGTVRAFAAAMEVADRHVRAHLEELRNSR